MADEEYFLRAVLGRTGDERRDLPFFDSNGRPRFRRRPDSDVGGIAAELDLVSVAAFDLELIKSDQVLQISSCIQEGCDIRDSSDRQLE